MRKLIAALVGIAVCGLVVTAQAGGDAAKGKTIYGDRKCGVCHKTTKDDAAGGKLSTVLADTVGKLSVADMKGWLTDAAKMEAKLKPKPVMPMSGFLKNLKPALSEAEIANLIAYLQTLPPKAPAPDPQAASAPPTAQQSQLQQQADSLKAVAAATSGVQATTTAPVVAGAQGTAAAPAPAPAPAAAARPAPTPEQQALTAATAIKDPTEKLAALAKVRTDFPANASQVDNAVLDTLIASFPDRKDDIAKAIDQVIADIPAAATPAARLTPVQNLASRLADKSVALDKIEPLLSGALNALTLDEFAKVQRAGGGGRGGRGSGGGAGGNGAQPATTLTDAEIATRFAQTRARSLELLGIIHSATGDLARAEAEYKEAYAAQPSLLRAPVGLAEIEAKRGNDEAALEYYFAVDLTGRLKNSDEDAMRALYKKAHGSEAGLSADLDRVYREKFPNPLKVEEYKPTAARSSRLVLMELFTGSGCPPCVAADLAWDGLLERYASKDVAALEFHANAPLPDPMVVAGGDVRRLYYKVTGVPTMEVDGVMVAGQRGGTLGGGPRENTPSNYAAYIKMIDADLEKAPAATVNVSAAWDGAKIKVTATADQFPSDAKDLRLHIVVAERELHFTGENGVRFHSMVVRDVAGTDGKAGDGFPITDVTGKTSVDYTFDLAAIKEDVTKTIAAEIVKRRATEEKTGKAPGDYRAENHAMTEIDPDALVVVAYVQDADKKVLQAARVDVPAQTKTPVKR